MQQMLDTGRQQSSIHTDAGIAHTIQKYQQMLDMGGQTYIIIYMQPLAWC